ncbi:MAG: HNH endonuclease signature motif containing protein, partial [Mycobacterium sp.]
ADAAPVHAEPAGEPRPVGYLLSGQVVPPNLLADLAARGAKIKTITSAKDLGGVDRYRPTAAQAAFVRMRAMTCTFPGCTAPAVNCDIDHVIPYPAGPTHPGNLGPKCRKHHLLKTFYGGSGGWRDHQQPDGTVIWTSPTGHRYRCVPGSRILFPDISFDTPLPPTASTQCPTAGPGRYIMMPARRRTRTQDRAARIAHERKRNEDELTKWVYEKPYTARQEPISPILGSDSPLGRPPPF